MFIQVHQQIQVDGDYTILMGLNDFNLPAVELMYQGDEVGFAYAERRFAFEWFVNSLWVDEEHRGKGLAVHLLKALRDCICWKMESQRCKLTPQDWTKRRYSFYKKGQSGTSLAALRVWDKLGGGPI